MNQKKILVVGELNADLILNDIRGFPKIGREIIADSMNLVMGSSSAIFASNISTLGCSVSFAGIVGLDFFGKFILQELEKKNIGISLVQFSKKNKTGITVVLNYAQDRANVTHCGAMNELKGSHIPDDKLEEFDHLHFSSYFLQRGMQKDICRLFKTAKEKGLTTSLDLQWDPENRWNFSYKECLPFVDVFLPNELELRALSGEGDIYTALENIGQFAPLIAVKRGEKGAIAYEKGKETTSSPFLHNHFVDAIGAGDSFNAGFLFKYLNGFSIEECLLYGNLAGAVSTTAPGGTGAFESVQSFNQKANTLFNIIF
jgi:sugar/nucleoside kinase (ribokinase family)